MGITLRGNGEIDDVTMTPSLIKVLHVCISYLDSTYDKYALKSQSNAIVVRVWRNSGSSNPRFSTALYQRLSAILGYEDRFLW